MSNVGHRTVKERLTEKIRAGRILKRMQAAALGEIEVTQQEIAAARLVLGKVLPDLKAVEQTIKDERKKTREQIDAQLVANGIDPKVIWQSTAKH